MLTNRGRPKSAKIFQMSVEISTKEAAVGAYTIEDTVSGKLYHGSTGNLYRRVTEHQNELKRGDHCSKQLQVAFNSGHPLKLSFYPTVNKGEAIWLEQKLLDITPREKLFNTSFSASSVFAGLWGLPEYRERFSTARKGNTNAKGHRMSSERKLKMSERLKGNKFALGSRHSDETKKKFSAARTGRRLSQEHVRNAALGRITGQVTVDGVLYESRSEVCRVFGVSFLTVTRRCKSVNFPNWTYIPKLKI